MKLNIQITTADDIPKYTEESLGQAIADDMHVQGIGMLRDMLPAIAPFAASIGRRIGGALSEMARKAEAYDRQRAQTEPRADSSESAKPPADPADPAECDCGWPSGSSETPGDST